MQLKATRDPMVLKEGNLPKKSTTENLLFNKKVFKKQSLNLINLKVF